MSGGEDCGTRGMCVGEWCSERSPQKCRLVLHGMGRMDWRSVRWGFELFGCGFLRRVGGRDEEIDGVMGW